MLAVSGGNIEADNKMRGEQDTRVVSVERLTLRGLILLQGTLPSRNGSTATSNSLKRNWYCVMGCSC